MKNLNGTENQVKYANDILDRFNAAIEFGLSKTKKEEYIQYLNDLKNEINSLMEAREIIERSKNVPELNGIPENISELGMMVQNKFSK